MTSRHEAADQDTSGPQPSGKYQRAKSSEVKEGVASSSATSGDEGPQKTVVVRGTRKRNVVVPFKLEREKERQRNLLANGWSPPSPSTEQKAR